MHHAPAFIRRFTLCACLLALVALTVGAQTTTPIKPGRAPEQAVDEEYTRKIREYTTEPFFLSPLVDYLPASTSVPTPKAVIGDVAGAPGKLPYSADVYRYMRLLEKATPRVKVYSIGKSEEGREMIAVAVASEQLIAQLDENRARLAKLADPRTIQLNDAEAERIVAASTPVYYITGTIHSPETGAPTALMELAYRLAVDESPYIKNIRENVITLITPVVEADGRDRQVDVYNWHLAHPGENWPPLVYWGHYVAHDNNRDAMGLTLNLTRNVLNTYLDWKAQVIHDLHESVPYLYDNTIGDGPYNAWLDPILTDEWQMIGWNNVSEMTKMGMPGVFAHGTFDTWSPGYLMFLAATHNGISRLYETFGNAGADTVERTLSPDEYERTWYRQNPPLPRVKWSQRNNNNYQQTGLLTALNYFANNKQLFLRNFYLKSKRSVEKPKNEGPAAYIFSADDPRPGTQAELLRTLQLQGCEISRATAPFTITVAPKRKPKPQGAPAANSNNAAANSNSNSSSNSNAAQGRTQAAPDTRTFPAGSYVVRMDQPYSRIADALLDYQYWSPNDPQRQPYDDTGWTFGELYGVRVVRVTDAKVLDAPLERVTGAVRAPGGMTGTGNIFAINHNADNALITLRYRLKNANIETAEEAFTSEGQKFNRGTFIVRGVSPAEIERAATDLGLHAHALAAAPPIKTHPARAARIALVHSWIGTQDEGWWRLAFDKLQIPYDYISTQDVSRDENLNAKYDVLVFAPVGRDPQSVVNGMPMWGNPIPWQTTQLTPNLGKIDSTPDMRPGLGLAGITNLQNFTRRGGLLITATDTSDLAINFGLTQGVATSRAQRMKLVGTVLHARLVDANSPIAYGYDETFSVYADSPSIYNVSNIAGGRGRRPSGDRERATGRGTPDDPDVVQGRPPVEAPEEPTAETWQAVPLTDEQRRNNPFVIPTAQRPRVIVRYADNRDLFVSGLLEGGGELAQHPAVVDVPVERGHVVLFSINPVWRGETQGSYFLVFNAIMNFDNLNAARKLDDK
ncbi:MAG TPA: M14 family zinc carboxypeptidase [Pyrinomonadaceae bacterium]|jgi:hypothetical protein